jgi:hypothetical protein
MTKSLKTSKPLLLIAFVVLSMWFVSCRTVHAQTNVSTESAMSNAIAAFNELQKQLDAAKSAATVQTIVFSNGVPVATNTVAAPVNAATITNYAEIALKVVEALGGLAAAVLVLARTLRKIIPDKSQVNGLGLALSHLSGEINPSIAKLSEAAAAPDKPIATNPPTV